MRMISGLVLKSRNGNVWSSADAKFPPCLAQPVSSVNTPVGALRDFNCAELWDHSSIRESTRAIGRGLNNPS